MTDVFNTMYRNTVYTVLLLSKTKSVRGLWLSGGSVCSLQLLAEKCGYTLLSFFVHFAAP